MNQVADLERSCPVGDRGRADLAELSAVSDRNIQNNFFDLI